MDSKIAHYTAELKEINIPKCPKCNKEFELKLTTLDPKTQLGRGEYLPNCNC